MKTLEETKNETAKSFGYRNNEDLINHMNPAWINEQIDLVAKRYAEQAIDRAAELLGDDGANVLDKFEMEALMDIKKELK